MRRDLIIGFLISLLIHGGIMFGDKLFKFQPKAKKAAAPPPKIELIEMPKLEPEEPEVVEQNEDLPKPEFIPPMQMDVPQVITDTSFVQQIQPPPPENIKPTSGIVNIPADRNQFKGIEVFDLSKLDQQPVARFQARPQYPFEMRRAGIAGEVVVDFIVDNNGDVQNAFSMRSSQREFENAAIQAVSKWKFKPGRKGGRNVNTHMQVPIVFTLNEE